jgi:PPOX class probable FMN-dependent enzyme
MNDFPDEAALRAHMGDVSAMAARKALPRLDRHGRAFIALSPFLVMATADADGKLDASPRGDPPGFVRVLDDTTLILPDRPGNNRVDSLSNLLANPHVGLIFFVPGIEETLRVNGTATIFTDPALLAESEVAGQVPRTGLRIAIDEVYFHCAKALKRSRLWDKDAQIPRSSFPSLGRIMADQLQEMSAEVAEERIETAYRTRLY